MTIINADLEIDNLNTQVKVRKEEAKDYRDEGDINEAIKVLEEAVAILRNSPLFAGLENLNTVTSSEKKLASHLADCLGMIGGNYRRLDKFEEALRYFERGRLYEESNLLDVNSSYNLVNAITLPLEMKIKTVKEQQDALTSAVASIERQVHGERRNDRWAWADLGQCQLLLGDVEAAEKSYMKVKDLGDKNSIYSTVTVLKRLEKTVENSDPELAERLKKGIQYLEM